MMYNTRCLELHAVKNGPIHYFYLLKWYLTTTIPLLRWCEAFNHLNRPQHFYILVMSGEGVKYLNQLQQSALAGWLFFNLSLMWWQLPRQQIKILMLLASCVVS